MKTMVHPNGCVHNVRDDLVEKFTKAGWKVAKKQPKNNKTEDTENTEDT